MIFNLPIADIQHKDTIFEDDFSNNVAGWEIIEDEDEGEDISEGEDESSKTKAYTMVEDKNVKAKLDKIKQLKNNFRPDKLKEGVTTPGYTSYSINKGEQIVLCLRNNDKLVDINTLFFVVLHEFAHLATESIGHTDEFWDNFRWILEESINIGIYIKQDFKVKNEEYCGMTITSSPLE